MDDPQGPGLVRREVHLTDSRSPLVAQLAERATQQHIQGFVGDRHTEQHTAICVAATK
ncbi:hypothetical protein BN11_420026 [Nostocoides australiense Ben110]|uniref:Uncharacterized protein n=1 Tax=Nostocoides australiense Ben110 TaxID=1193182 RepID=W6JZR7_9MICO|nr:hypothetical protein BN11_420026 [Tetrasphaera australiensis Ben110]